MDLNIALNGIGTFNHVFSDEDKGSKRAKAGTAPGLPHFLTIRHTDYRDPVTKVSGRKSVVRFDQYVVIDPVGTIAPVSLYTVAAIPTGSVDLSAVVLANIKALSTVLASGLSDQYQLGLGQVIFNEQNQ